MPFMQLVPYLYSLAHRAHLAGEPVFPPVAFYFPADAAARTIGDTKLIGRDLLVAVTERRTADEIETYGNLVRDYLEARDDD